DAREVELARLGKRPRDQGLRKTRKVLEQDVAVGEQPDEHELERVTLADDGAFDLVDDRARLRREIRQRHFSSSSSATRSRSSSGRRPRPRSAGAPPPPRIPPP